VRATRLWLRTDTAHTQTTSTTDILPKNMSECVSEGVSGVVLRAGEVFPLECVSKGVRLEVEWRTPHSGLADLDVYVLLYDENVSE
jgi:hypothetical protein